MNSIRQTKIERPRCRSFVGTLQRAGLVSALTLFTALPSYAYSWYSSASVGPDGTVYGWGVTDVTCYSMYHMAYVWVTLTSPKGRQNGPGYWSAQNSVRGDAMLTFDPTDLGTYQVQSTNQGYCYFCNCLIVNCGSGASALLRMTQWAALRYDSTTTDVCGYTIRERTYQGLDTYGWIPNAEYWKLNESFTSKDPSCSVTINIDGDNNQDVGFPDEIEIGCGNPTSCTFQTNQTFSVAPIKAQPLTQVPGVECLSPMTDTQCLAQVNGGAAHTGWHIKATATSITVTNNP